MMRDAHLLDVLIEMRAEVVRLHLAGQIVRVQVLPKTTHVCLLDNSFLACDWAPQCCEELPAKKVG